MSRPTLVLFGAPRVERDGAAVSFDRRKALALLAYLALNRRPHRRETLAALLWPKLDQAHAHAALRRTLVAIKQGIGSESLEASREMVGLGDGDTLWVDVVRFEELLNAQQLHRHSHDRLCSLCLEMLSEAAALYAGGFMAGFTLPDSPDYDDWQREVGESLRREVIGILEKLVRGCAGQGALEAAISHAQRWLSIDPLCEEAYRHLMRLYAQCGQVAAAIDRYQVCQEILVRELGLAPAPETVQLYHDICANLPLPSLSTQEAPLSNLPSQTTPFIGRRLELAAIAERLTQPDCRLLTLVGPGGIGKTRLALQAAATQVSCFAHGVYLVPLGSVQAAESIMPAIAQAIGLSFSHPAEEAQGPALFSIPSPEVQLLDYLGNKHMLLVLDNMEHLVNGAGLLNRLLAQTSEIKLLVTSRERLNLRSEWLFEVQGMQVPAEHTADWADVERSDTGRLFLESAHRVAPEFSAETQDLIHICRQLDGMPLAIELAASWTQVLSGREIAAQVDRALAGESTGLFTSPLHDLPERHRSMRAVFDSSWTMLSSAEQLVLAALSVFQGAMNWAAAEHVAGASLSALAALVDKSLLRVVPSPADGETRYVLHELLRHYAHVKLEGQNRVQDIRDSHCCFYATWLSEKVTFLGGSRLCQMLDEIELEIGNLLSAWQWALEHGRRVELDQLLDGLYLFYTTRSRLQEGQAVLQQAVEIFKAEDARRKDLLLGRLLNRLGRLAYQLHDVDAAGERLQSSLDLLPSSNPLEIAQNLLWFSDVVWQRKQYGSAAVLLYKSLALTTAGPDSPESRHLSAQILCRLADRMVVWQDDTAAERLYRQGLRLFQALSDQYAMAAPLVGLARLVSWHRRWSEAELLVRESLDIRRQVQDRRGAAWCLHMWAENERGQARYAKARDLYGQSLAIYRELGDGRAVMNMLSRLTTILYWLGDDQALDKVHQECYALAQGFGDPFVLACALEGLGQSAHLKGDYAQARTYYTESLRIGQEIAHPRVITWSLVGLADVDLVDGQYAVARAQYEKGLGIAQEQRVADGISKCLIRLADVTCTAGDYVASQEYLAEALHFELDRGHAGAIVGVLSYAPLLLTRLEQVEEALALCTFLLQRPELCYPDLERLGRLFDDLVAEFSPEVVASIQEQNRDKTLEKVSQAVLTLLAKN